MPIVLHTGTGQAKFLVVRRRVYLRPSMLGRDLWERSIRPWAHVYVFINAQVETRGALCIIFCTRRIFWPSCDRYVCVHPCLSNTRSLFGLTRACGFSRAWASRVIGNSGSSSLISRLHLLHALVLCICRWRLSAAIVDLEKPLRFA